MNSLVIGAFARIWQGTDLASLPGRMRASGVTTCQWNFRTLGRPPIDPTVTPEDCAAIRKTLHAGGVGIWGLSATYNIADPDRGQREHMTAKALKQITYAPQLGAEVVTLCSGTRDPENMWRAHPDNATPEAWEDAMSTLGRLARQASDSGVLLGIEPERGNIVSSADAAVRMLDLFGPGAPFSIVLDPANLLSVGQLPDQAGILTDAFERLGARTSALHAKDVVASGYSAAGAGGLDYELIARLHRQYTPDVPVIIQDARPDDVRRVADLLTAAWEKAAVQ